MAVEKKIWVDFAGYILQGTFYRVPFKSILRVQIKHATDFKTKSKVTSTELMLKWLRL